MIGINPYGPAAIGNFGMADPWMGGPSLAGNRLMGEANPMAAAAMGGGLNQMMGYNEMAYQGLMTQLVQIMAALMAQQGQNSAGSSSNANTTDSSGSSGSSSSSGSSGGGVDASQFSGGTENGRKLAAAAKAEATNGDSQGGLCYRDVARSLKSIGVNVSGASAYMAADQLAQNPKVKEIKVAQSELSKLPPGAIVVWDKGAGHEHGHISVSTGDGKEASDLMRTQITNYGTSFRVFMPV